jgi:serine/threonine protein kinase
MPGTQIDEHAIFAVAIKISDPNTREAYLAQVCNNDSALFDRVSSLLQANEINPKFLEGRPAELSPTLGHSESANQEGKRLGNYKLLQQIGEGGFGIVYMADQDKPVRRKVALKIIKPGMDSEEVVARFEAERQALALMEHPNIARVLDAGATDSGNPYFVMHLVKGMPITEYCDKHKLTTSQRLRLFAQVCRVVQHAHQKGIIRRDLKPSNILVTHHDGEPVSNVIDFGVAKALSQELTERTMFTRFGQVIGTPQYMSPQQADMNGIGVDTRTDIYSLGVVLYELLTGRPPFTSEELTGIKFIKKWEPAAVVLQWSSSRMRATGVGNECWR